jgi:hypothetical protein
VLGVFDAVGEHLLPTRGVAGQEDPRGAEVLTEPLDVGHEVGQRVLVRLLRAGRLPAVPRVEVDHRAVPLQGRLREQVTDRGTPTGRREQQDRAGSADLVVQSVPGDVGRVAPGRQTLVDRLSGVPRRAGPGRDWCISSAHVRTVRPAAASGHPQDHRTGQPRRSTPTRFLRRPSCRSPDTGGRPVHRWQGRPCRRRRASRTQDGARPGGRAPSLRSAARQRTVSEYSE